MNSEALAYLVCPTCRRPLSAKIHREINGEVHEGSLHCSECDAVYPIREGVPRFIVGTESREVAESFGFQWRARERGKFEQQTLYGLSASDELAAFFRSLAMAPTEAKGAHMLDAGCGDGSLMRVVSGVVEAVVGIDINTSIDTAYRMCRGCQNVSVVAADLFASPFPPATFDIVWAEGVIVHTPDPRRAFRRLAELVKPGGTLYVWVYSKDRRAVYQRIRDLLVAPYRLPKNLLLGLSYAIAVPIFLTARPYAAWRGRRGKGVDAKPSLRAVAFGLFDNLSPRFQSRHTVEEITRWFDEEGFRDVTQTGMIGMAGRKR
ncbi:MAG TPA: methyltransferase domain-containing protein [Methylomirabilota bacterium]|jgi:SAM-dependent methyltransferase